MDTLKICLVGTSTEVAPVGKTTWIKFLLKNGLYENPTGSFYDKVYVPTLGVEVHRLHVLVTQDKLYGQQLELHIWDCAGSKYKGLSIGYYIQGDGFIVGCQPNSTFSNMIHDTDMIRCMHEQLDLLTSLSLVNAPIVKTMFRADEALYETEEHCLLVSSVDCAVSTSHQSNLLTPLNLLLGKIYNDVDLEVQLV